MAGRSNKTRWFWLARQKMCFCLTDKIPFGFHEQQHERLSSTTHPNPFHKTFWPRSRLKKQHTNAKEFANEEPASLTPTRTNLHRLMNTRRDEAFDQDVLGSPRELFPHLQTKQDKLQECPTIIAHVSRKFSFRSFFFDSHPVVHVCACQARTFLGGIGL